MLIAPSCQDTRSCASTACRRQASLVSRPASRGARRPRARRPGRPTSRRPPTTRTRRTSSARLDRGVEVVQARGEAGRRRDERQLGLDHSIQPLGQIAGGEPLCARAWASRTSSRAKASARAHSVAGSGDAHICSDRPAATQQPDPRPRHPSALRPTAQYGQGVLDALLEDIVGKALVGKGAGDLEGPDHQCEDTERLHAR